MQQLGIKMFGDIKCIFHDSSFLFLAFWASNSAFAASAAALLASSIAFPQSWTATMVNSPCWVIIYSWEILVLILIISMSFFVKWGYISGVFEFALDELATDIPEVADWGSDVDGLLRSYGFFGSLQRDSLLWGAYHPGWKSRRRSSLPSPSWS